MPIYEYKCKECSTKFELMRSFSEADAPSKCPNCGAEQTQRQLSLVNAFSAGKSLTSSNSCGSCSSGNCSSCGMN